MDQVFSFLGNSIPGWSLPLSEADQAKGIGQLPTSAPVEAMHRIISMAEDATEGTHRLHELIKAAVAQFNEGLLSRAVTMFELAEKVIAEGKVKPAVIEALRRTGHEFLKPERLKQYGDAPERHAQLRKVMAFYLALRPAGLLEELAISPKRDRRRQLLTFLEAHGSAGRAEVLEWLQRSFTGVIARDDWQHSAKPGARPAPHPQARRRVARAGARDAGGARRSGAAWAGGERGHHGAVADPRRQGGAAAGAPRGALRGALVAGRAARAEASEIQGLIDRAVSGLIRIGTPNARRAVVAHGLKGDARLGDTVGRLGGAWRASISRRTRRWSTSSRRRSRRTCRRRCSASS